MARLSDHTTHNVKGMSVVHLAAAVQDWSRDIIRTISLVCGASSGSYNRIIYLVCGASSGSYNRVISLDQSWTAGLGRVA